MHVKFLDIPSRPSPLDRRTSHLVRRSAQGGSDGVAGLGAQRDGTLLPWVQGTAHAHAAWVPRGGVFYSSTI